MLGFFSENLETHKKIDFMVKICTLLVDMSNPNENNFCIVSSLGEGVLKLDIMLM